MDVDPRWRSLRKLEAEAARLNAEMTRMEIRLALAEHDRDAARRLTEEFAQRLADVTGVDVHLPWPCGTPDPDHVPAVRRVVAWKAASGNVLTWRDLAYEQAAEHLLRSAWERGFRPGATLEGWLGKHWPWPRIQRLASALRHRDEEAGHG